MDSMRSLNTSLPATSSPRRRQQSQPPEQLLQLFKHAALSVTNLYKATASEHDKAYREGYQDALEELLGFLDNENLGLQDGEGWQVRQWATERFDGTPTTMGRPNVESDEEENEEEKRARSSSPGLQHKTAQDRPEQLAHIPESISHTISESAPPIAAPLPVEPEERRDLQTYTIPQAEFTFQSSQQYPSARDIEMDSLDSNNGSTVHVNIMGRSNRTSRQNSRNTNRSASTLGQGAGMKRRLPNFDFFDLGGFNGKDGAGGGAGNGGNGGGGGGGGKRGRFV